MSKTQPDSSRVLEGSRHDGEMPSTAAVMTDAFLNDPGVRTAPGDHELWLSTARRCYQSSTDFFDGHLRSSIEESMSLYRSEHPKGSKYNHPSYAKRSKLFRPKIRAALRKKEAAIAKAFFSTHDNVVVSAPNPRSAEQVLAARIQQELLNYRLQTTVPWYVTVIGAFQDAERQGFVISRTDWHYEEATRYFVGPDGQRTSEKVPKRDTPRITLIPGENLRVNPNCDWTDPIESSDYLIELMPMSLGKLREMRNRETTLRWLEVPDSALLTGLKHNWDSVRLAREGKRGDRYDQTSGIDEFETVWVHRNIIRVEGEDYVYLTLGTELMLTEPQPLSEIDPRGYRGYEWGWAAIESHNPYPDGEVQLAKPVQEEINELANMRADAAKMAMMGRYFVRRNSSVDVQALVRPVPGSAVEMNDPNRDAKWERPAEVGRTAYEEHNLLNTEMDDLLGNFGAGNVAANRQLNETVGGLKLIADNANEISEFTARTFTETWIEKVLTHVLDLICLWETDATLVTLIGDKLRTEAGVVWRSITSPLPVKVAVGFGATNPESRVRRLQMGLGTIASLAPSMMQQADQAAIASEIMGAMGYADGARFFPSLDGEEDPRIAQMQQEIQQLQQMIEGKQLEMQSKERVAQIAADARVRVEEMKQASAERQLQLKNELTLLIEQGKAELSMIELRLKYEQNEMARMELYMQREALSHTIQMAEREFALKVQATALAPPPHADVPDTPPGVADLVRNLGEPGSGSVNLEDADVGMPAVGGDDKAGVLARGNYGSIPFAEG